MDSRFSKRYYTTDNVFHSLVLKIFTPLIKNLIMDIRVEGIENVPASGPLVLVVNHMTNFDVFPIQICLSNRPIFFMAKEELFRNPLTDLLFRSLLAFPVYRGAGDGWAMEFAINLLKRGQVVGIFPQGKRRRDINLGRGKSGAARLAIEVGCPILPMALDGTQRLFSSIPRRAPIRVSIGEMIYPDREENIAQFTQRIMGCIGGMLEELRESEPVTHISDLSK